MSITILCTFVEKYHRCEDDTREVPGFAMTGVEPSLKRRKITIELVQQQEMERSDAKVAKLLKVFGKDTSAADAYTLLTRDGVPVAWVNNLLDDFM